MEEWLNSQFIFQVTTTIFDSGVDQLFSLVAEAYEAFLIPIQIAAAIYIALMGWGVMTGMITMSTREMAIRFAKVIAILVALGAFIGYGGDMYESIWDIPDGIGDYFVENLAPILGLGGSIGISNMDSLSALYTGLSSQVSIQATQAHDDQTIWGIGTWVITMAPFALTVIGIYLAKFISALLLLVSPVVLMLSLTIGSFRGQDIIMPWLKALLMTFLTAIFVYIVGVAGLLMMAKYMGVLMGADVFSSLIPGFGDNLFSLVHLAPLAILAMMTIVLVSQASSVASSLLGIAGLNTQQATSFMQIAALQSAARAG